MKREMNLKWILLGNFTTVETRHAKKSVNFFFSCSMLNIGRTVNRSFIEIYPVAAV